MRHYCQEESHLTYSLSLILNRALGLSNQWKLTKRKTRNSSKALLGFPYQLHVGAKASNRFPCLLPEVGWGLGRAPSLYRVGYLPTKVRLVKAMVFPEVMQGCESWTVKKAERRSIDAFELWCWRRLLRVPWTARRSNQSILKEISPGISLERMMLKLKLQYFGHLMQRVDSLEKTLMLGGIGGRRRRGR